MTEPVSFELAKLLNEKGFPGLKTFYTSKQYELITNKHTIAHVVMWLYKKHNIWIEVRRSYLLDKFVAITKNPRRELSACTSPEEAYEKAIEYTLKNLI